MALEYRILFPDSAPAPALADFLALLPAIPTTHSLVVREERSWLVLDETYELVFTISANDKVDYLDFSFGAYAYQVSWYIRFNTFNRFLAKDIFSGLLKQLLSTVSSFVTVFNSELIILRKENDEVYLNSLGGAWEDAGLPIDSLPNNYTLIEYPVV